MPLNSSSNPVVFSNKSCNNSTLNANMALNTKYDIDFSKDGLYINDELYCSLSGYSSPFTTNKTIYLFANTKFESVIRLYGTKIYENNKLVHKMRVTNSHFYFD